MWQMWQAYGRTWLSRINKNIHYEYVLYNSRLFHIELGLQPVWGDIRMYKNYFCNADQIHILQDKKFYIAYLVLPLLVWRQFFLISHIQLLYRHWRISWWPGCCFQTRPPWLTWRASLPIPNLFLRQNALSFLQNISNRIRRRATL